MHKVPVTFSTVSKQTRHFNTFIWVIVDRFSQSCCVDCHTFCPLMFHPFSQWNCSTLHIFWLFSSGHSAFFFPSEPLMTRSHNCVILTVLLFLLPLSFVNVTKVSCKRIIIVYKWTLCSYPVTPLCMTVTLSHCFQVYAPLSCFFLIHWWQLLIITLF